MFIYGFSHSVAHRMFPCFAWRIIMDKADKPDLLRSTRCPFKSMDLALSREVNRQGQRNRTISFLEHNAMLTPVEFISSRGHYYRVDDPT